MSNIIDELEIREVNQGLVREGMILAESFTCGYAAQQRKDVFSLRFGAPLDAASTELLNNLKDHPETRRKRDVKKEDGLDTAPFQIFRITSGTQRDWIESFAQDLLVRERTTEKLKQYRDQGSNLTITNLSKSVKKLLSEIINTELNIKDTVLTKTRHHHALEDLLRSPDFRKNIEEGIINPISSRPIIGIFLSYDPGEMEHSLDVTTLAVRITYEVVIPIETISSLAVSSLMHDIGRVYLLEAFRNQRKKITSPQLMAIHGIYFVEKVLTTGEEKTPIDGLNQEQIEIMKHHHTRRDGSGPKEPSKDKRGIIYIGKDVRYETDTPELLIKTAGWKNKSEKSKEPQVRECPVSENEFLYLAERWVTYIERKETSKLEAAKLLKDIKAESGLCARTDYVDAFIKTMESYLAPRSPMSA